MILRLSLICFLSFVNSYALSVLISKEAINFEEKLDTSKLRLTNVKALKKSCNPLTLGQIQNNEYLTTHYINKNTILCEKDVKKYKNNSVLFNFGSLQIEKKGKIIYENDEFIRIKNIDGSIEKIYKDGRLK